MSAKVYKQFYKWFDGRHQAVHSIFMEKVQSHNNRKIGLVRASETRLFDLLASYLLTQSSSARNCCQSQIQELGKLSETT
jgi:hypothetical protein